MAFRTKGQNVTVTMLVDDTAHPAIETVLNFEFEMQQDVTTQGYLSEKTDRRDSVYTGVSGKFTLHLSKSSALTLLKAIRDKAKDPTTAPRFDIKADVEFAEGVYTISIPDVSFGSVPFSAGGRTEFNSIDIPFEAADFDVLS